MQGTGLEMGRHWWETVGMGKFEQFLWLSCSRGWKEAVVGEGESGERGQLLSAFFGAMLLGTWGEFWEVQDLASCMPGL